MVGFYDKKLLIYNFIEYLARKSGTPKYAIRIDEASVRPGNYEPFINEVKRIFETLKETEKTQKDGNSYKVKQLLNIISEPRSIQSFFDFGCGDGNLSRELKSQLGEDAILVTADIYDHQFNHNSEQRHILLKSDQYKVDCEDNQFELVTALLVLHHNLKPEKWIKELARITKQNGQIIIYEHNFDEHDTNQESKIFFEMYLNLYF